MLQQPQVKAHFHVEVVDGEGIFLLSEKGHAVLRGRLYELVAPCLDGRRSPDDIVDRLRDQASPAEVYYALRQLEKKGYLADGGATAPAGEAAFWHIQDTDAGAAARRLPETAVSVTSLGGLAVAPLVAALQALRVRVTEDGQLGVVLTDDYLRSGLEACNREALRTGRPWLLIKPVGAQLWVGPLFRAGQTGCWECLAQRQRANREVEGYLQEKNGRAEPLPVPRASTPATQQIAWALAATEIAQWLVRGESTNLEGKILTVEVGSWKTQTHALTRRPQCPACGAADRQRQPPAPPVVLESRKKTFTQDGGHRVHSPETTLQRYGHHVSPITGAVTMLERVGRSNDGVMHVYAAGQNSAVRQRSLEGLRGGLRSLSSGKGAGDLQAKASGLCEALERYSGVFRGDEPRRTARLRDLGEAAIHPNACMQYSETQYRERDAWNAKKSYFNFVPLPFDEEAAVEWTPVWSLTRREVRYLPTAWCYFAYPEPGEEPSCAACSNGNAAGNTLEEAILQGFLELVERDCVALWWYNRVRRPAVALDSFNEPYLRQLSAFLGDLQRDLWALDLTSDLHIPVFVALSRRTDRQPEEILFGFGAHLDPRIALLRAVTELNQMLTWVLPGGPGEQPARDAIDDPETLRWLQTATLADQPYLVPDERTPARVASDYPRLWTDDLKDDVLACQALVERHGLEMLVLDQTRPDIGLPVVKVIVPGLRHFWARFAPGRLYDVPVRLGWLPDPLREQQLNPIPLFL
ncbi:MAG TPA: TOMM precursor leader peptide-binding protein [Gemmataceae bacterium]|nr:TOMM precursor leader peptide-binding protein [Gemmataceae bacterium]